MKKTLLTVIGSVFFACLAQATGTLFTPGNLAVLQECDGGPGRCLPLGANGTTTLITNYSPSDIASSRQNQIFIDEYDPNGVNQTTNYLHQVAIPTNGPTAMLINGNAGTEGGLTLSGDKSVLTFAAYQGDLLSITTGGQTAPSNLSYDRGIGTVDAFGHYVNVYRGGAWYGIATGKTNPRGVATDGAGQFWGCGNGYGSLYYDANTGEQPIQFQNIALTSCSKVINGKVYSSVKSSESVNLYPAGIYSFVDFYNNPVNYPSSASFLHLEIPAAAPYTTCIGFDINPQNNIAYVADTTYGIQKYYKAGLSWKLAYNLSIPGYFGQTNGIMGNPGATNVTAGCFSVAVDWNGTNPVVYATTTDSGSDTKSTYYGNRVIRINDTNTVQSGINIMVTTNMNILTTVVRPPIISGIQITNIAFKSVTFTPDLRPVITNNPVSWSAVTGDNVSFNVGAYSSSGNLTYQWLQNDTNLVGQTSAVLNLSSVDLSLNNATYRCVVNNNYGAITSSIATLLVFSTAQLPVIGTVQNITNYVGNNQSITVNVSGTDPKGGYQWYLSGVALTDGLTVSGSTLSGTTTATLTIGQAGTNDQGGYSVSVTNIAGSASNIVANFVTTYAPPVIVQSPAALTTFVGVPVANNASAAGSLLNEAWYKGYVTVNTNTTTITVVTTNGIQQSNKTNATSVAFNYVTNLLSDGAAYSGTASTVLSILNPQLSDAAASVLQPLVYATNSTSKFTTNAAQTIITNTTTTAIATTIVTNYTGYYSIVFSNPGGAVTSSPVALSVMVQPAHSFLLYSNNGAIYSQNFNSLPVNGGSSADAANPAGIQVITNFTVIDLTTGGPLNTYSLGSPFDFAYPIIGQSRIGGLGLSGKMAGWYAWASGTMQFGATYGDQSAGGIIDNGQNYVGPGTPLTSITNRALGMISTTKSGYTAFGLGVINKTTNTLDYINLSFLGELWRNNPNQQVIGFSYAVDTAGTNSSFNPGSPDGSIPGAWTPTSVHGLDVVFQTNSATSINDGTQSSNQVSVATNSLSVSGWTPGSTLWLVWESQNPTGGAQAVAIDNLSFSASAAPIGTLVTPITITPGSAKITGSGASARASFSFTNASGLAFTVLATNNIAAPKANWPVVGTAVENPVGSGHYQFTDPNPTTNTTRFYILSQP